jgi:hypothetical protein
MMLHLDLLLALDNMAVAAALGAAGLSARRAIFLALLFGASECLLAFAGIGLSGFLRPIFVFIEPMRLAALTILGVALIGLALLRRDSGKVVCNVWALAGLALLLGLDDFIAALAKPLILPTWPLLFAGLVTAAASFIACNIARTAAAFMPNRWAACAGGALLVAVAATG